MALNSTKMNCSDVRTPSSLTVADSIANNMTEAPKDEFMVDNESQRIITESHENSFQTALLYISIILSVYLLTIMFIGIRYALNRYYDKTFDFCCSIQCSQCCECCEFCSPSHMSCSCCDSTNRKRNDYFTSSSPSSSRMATSQLRNCNSAVCLSPDDLNTIEVTQTDEGLLETDL